MNPPTWQCQHRRRRPGGWASGIGGWRRPSESPRSHGSCPRWTGSSASSARCWPCRRWWCSGSSWCLRHGESPHEWAERKGSRWAWSIVIPSQLIPEAKIQWNPSAQITHTIKQKWSWKRSGLWTGVDLHGNMTERSQKKSGLKRDVVFGQKFIYMETWWKTEKKVVLEKGWSLNRGYCA